MHENIAVALHDHRQHRYMPNIVFALSKEKTSKVLHHLSLVGESTDKNIFQQCGKRLNHFITSSWSKKCSWNIFLVHDIECIAVAPHGRCSVWNPQLLVQQFIHASIKGNIKGPHHWRLLGGMHRWPVDSPPKGPIILKAFPCDDVVMISLANLVTLTYLYTYVHCEADLAVLLPWLYIAQPSHFYAAGFLSCALARAPWDVLLWLYICHILLWWCSWLGVTQNFMHCWALYIYDGLKRRVKLWKRIINFCTKNSDTTWWRHMYL